MRVADTFRALKIREAKSWKVIDYALSDSCKDLSQRLRAAEFILRRLYPEEMKVLGSGEDGEIVIKIEHCNNDNNLQTPRFAIPHIQ